jgi:hypothetical protein
MDETLRHYDLNGQVLTMAALANAPADLLDPILAPFAVTASGTPDCRITVQLVETLPPAPRGPFRWQGRLPEGPDASLVHRDGQRILHAPGHYEVGLQDNAEAGAIALRPGSAGLLAATAGFWLLGHILGARGRHLVHAACLVKGGTEDVILLFAPSGTGKTTTALALARNGYGLAGDDAAVFELGPAGPRAWALPRALRIHSQTADLLPWVRPALPARGKRRAQTIGLRALAGVVDCVDSRQRRCAGLAVLEPPNGNVHRVAPLDKTEAALRILDDNLRQPPGGLDPSGQRLFVALVDLVSALPVIAISAGPDPSTLDPALLEDAWRLAGATARNPETQPERQ